MINIILYLIFIFFINYFIKKKQFIKSSTGSSHQTFANDSVPLSGGIYIFLPLIVLYLKDYPILLVAYISFFCLGFLSDLNILQSPKKRFFLQLLILLFYVYTSKLEIASTRVEIVDFFFENIFLSYIFTVFCLTVFINGSNFIDGLNSLLLVYFLLILFFLFKLELLNEINLNSYKEITILIVLIFLIIMNFSNQLFLGDNGSYSLSFLMGFFLINIYNYNQGITPYFIILLLWYPCFENLFSIFRKFFSKKNPLEPDNDHLHYRIYSFLIKKFNCSKLKSNNSASLLINSFNLLIFYVASLNIYHTSYQLIVISCSVIFYLTIFFLLKRFILN